ncbi:DUF927 domain-containing protein [Peribacillus butanolivorans]|uniref:DUF927 domain-containing protein n=1 Tax=Peribacillus butanolivorans TaxID=421767 RepID=UPI0006A72E45|nr:DUF927 domain-containing protein [Peribacillus butanolivorans]
MSKSEAKKVINLPLNTQVQFDEKKYTIPAPYLIQDGRLFVTVKGEEVPVSRHIPVITKEYTDLESGNDYVEITWKELDKIKKFIESSSILGRKKDLLEMSVKGLSVNENNYKKVMEFLDKFLIENQEDKKLLTTRLGNVKGEFIHPNLIGDIIIAPGSDGEAQVLKSFQEKGTIESWQTEVLDLVRDHPKVMFFLVASFAAVLVKDVDINSFIVDLSGFTSEGKSTTLQVASTVWGSKEYVGGWKSTAVGVERLSNFLQNFPVILDDTRNASEKILREVAYDFSQNKGKIRGSIIGMQKLSTWRSILLTSGEVPILDYCDRAGQSARIVQIKDNPFNEYEQDYMFKLYKAMSNNYGVVGRTFLERWLNLDLENKNKLLAHYQEIRSRYANNSNGNDVLSRISANYALIHFTAQLLNQFFDFNIDTKPFEEMFLKESQENKTLDKPRQLLEKMLGELNSSRKNIFYEGEYEPDQVDAIYKNAKKGEKDKLYFTVEFCNRFLEKESNQIRKQWQKLYNYTKKWKR